MSGTLYICATPIGNMEDITLRVLRLLKEADYIAAEDTRQTVKLLNKYEISTPMVSYHEHNKREAGQKLINRLMDGKNIALVTDAGMPGISDPGADLIALAYEHDIKVTCAPGATAFAAAAVLSGIPCGSFVFEGFLPNKRDKKQRAAALEYLKTCTKTVVLYEAPHHLLSTLEDLYTALGDRRASVIRELTKKHEEVLRGSLEMLITHFRENEPRGEIVIVLEGAAENVQECIVSEQIGIAEQIKQYIDAGMDKMDAVKKVAKERGIPKRDVYKYAVKKLEEE